MRRNALYSISRGSKNGYKPEEIKKIFDIENDNEFEKFIKYYKLEIGEEDYINIDVYII